MKRFMPYDFGELATGFILIAMGAGIITASGCGIAWQLKAEKIKPCPVEESTEVKVQLLELQQTLDAFKRKL